MSAAVAAFCTIFLTADPVQRDMLDLRAASFNWSGNGLFPQLFALVLFPPALGALWRAVSTGRRYGIALLLLSTMRRSHRLFGYSACLLGVLLLFRPEARGRRK